MNKSLKKSLLCALVISFTLSGCNKPVVQDTVSMDAVPSEIAADAVKVSNAENRLSKAKALYAKCLAKGMNNLVGDEVTTCDAASNTVFFQPYKSGSK